MARAFATRAFEKWRRRERIEDATLLDAVEAADAGIIDANLLGCLVKFRIARKGGGKRDGYRTVVAYQKGDKAFFLYGFAKNDRENIGRDEAEILNEVGTALLGETEAQIVEAIDVGKIREIKR